MFAERCAAPPSERSAVGFVPRRRCTSDPSTITISTKDAAHSEATGTEDAHPFVSVVGAAWLLMSQTNITEHVKLNRRTRRKALTRSTLAPVNRRRSPSWSHAASGAAAQPGDGEVWPAQPTATQEGPR